MSEQSDQSSVLMLQVIEQVEKRIQDRETKRFRLLYGMIALVSFIGIGVISQLIELYATRAVDQRLEMSRLELESAKTYAQLTALATKLDISDSFTRSDRDAVMRLLDIAAPNKKLRAEPAFESLLEKIIDSFAQADNGIFVSRVFDAFEPECLNNPGITQTLIQHYGMRILGTPDRTSESFLRDVKRFNSVADASHTYGHRGMVAALRSLVAFHMAKSARTEELDTVLRSYAALDADDKDDFNRVIKRFSRAPSIVKNSEPTPELIRVAGVTAAFQKGYASELELLAAAQ